jgi:porphobilinogen deaminase
MPKDGVANSFFEDWLQSEIRRLDEGLSDLRRSAQERNDANQLALEAARRDLDRRIEGLNEFRAQLASQQAGFITRREYDAKHEALITAMGLLRDTLSDVRRTAAWSGGRLMGAIAAAAFFVTAAIAVIGLVIRYTHG